MHIIQSGVLSFFHLASVPFGFLSWTFCIISLLAYLFSKCNNDLLKKKEHSESAEMKGCQFNLLETWLDKSLLCYSLVLINKVGSSFIICINEWKALVNGWLRINYLRHTASKKNTEARLGLSERLNRLPMSHFYWSLTHVKEDRDHHQNVITPHHSISEQITP